MTETVVTGFLLAHRKNSSGAAAAGGDVFYIDLICSRYRQGSKLLKEAENYARGLGCSSTALRAATAPLIAVYYRLGYKAMLDHCQHKDGRRFSSRVAERRLQRRNRTAIYRDGRGKAQPGDGFWMSKCLRKTGGDGGVDEISQQEVESAIKTLGDPQMSETMFEKYKDVEKSKAGSKGNKAKGLTMREFRNLLSEE